MSNASCCEREEKRDFSVRCGPQFFRWELRGLDAVWSAGSEVQEKIGRRGESGRAREAEEENEEEEEEGDR